MAYKLSISPSAVEDLDEIVAYIARSLDNPAAAAAFLDKVSSCYDRMEEMPYLYEECRDPNLRALGYRRAVIDHYVMVYSARLRETHINRSIIAKKAPRRGAFCVSPPAS